MTTMSVHLNVLTNVRSQLKFMLHSIVFERLSFGSSSKTMAAKLPCTSQLWSMYIYYKKLLQQFFIILKIKKLYNNSLRMLIEIKNIVVQTKCLLIYYINVLTLF